MEYNIFLVIIAGIFALACMVVKFSIYSREYVKGFYDELLDVLMIVDIIKDTAAIYVILDFLLYKL